MENLHGLGVFCLGLILDVALGKASCVDVALTARASRASASRLRVVCVCVAVPRPPVAEHIPLESVGPLHQSLDGYAPAPGWVGSSEESTWAGLQYFPAFVQREAALRGESLLRPALWSLWQTTRWTLRGNRGGCRPRIFKAPLQIRMNWSQVERVGAKPLQCQ